MPKQDDRIMMRWLFMPVAIGLVLLLALWLSG